MKTMFKSLAVLSSVLFFQAAQAQLGLKTNTSAAANATINASKATSAAVNATNRASVATGNAVKATTGAVKATSSATIQTGEKIKNNTKTLCKFCWRGFFNYDLFFCRLHHVCRFWNRRNRCNSFYRRI